MTAPFAGVFRGKRVFVTGHTGFKGAWMVEWLLQLGAEVTGYSHAVDDGPSLFTDLGLTDRMTHTIGDVRDGAALTAALDSAKPDFVFHLAAQALVRYSYDHPIETVETNVMGVLHLLDALRRLNRPTTCIIVTSDKCYENREVLAGYREDDAFGGKDPYSASKGAAEILAQSYLRSYFSAPDSRVKMATARAGNVIGGGDWSTDRILPDCIRDLMEGRPIGIRNPAASRPWQHVLEALSGYMWLATLLSGAATTARVTDPLDVAEGFNFGPWLTANVTVKILVEEVLTHWPGAWEIKGDSTAKPEAGLLALSIDKAFHKLDWRPALEFPQTVALTTLWYRNVAGGAASVPEQTAQDIAAYTAAAQAKSIRWAG
jgi:CDP-glucose 4,6-dehydratase